MNTFVKICGLRSAADVKAATDAGANAVGFVFAESVRRVSPARATCLLSATQTRHETTYGTDCGLGSFWALVTGRAAL